MLVTRINITRTGRPLHSRKLLIPKCDQVSTTHKGRRYRYYVCHTVRRQGWKSCSSKSVAANLIEDAFVVQLRERLSASEVRDKLQIPELQWQKFVEGDVHDLMGVLVERIQYDATSGKALVQLRRPHDLAGTTQP